MMKANQEEHRKAVVEQIKTTGSVLGVGLQGFLTDRTKIFATVGGFTALAVGWYTAKRGTSLGAKYIDARLGKPSLVRETSRLSLFEMFKYPVKTVKQAFKRSKDSLKRVVLNPSLESRLRDVAITTKNTERNLGLFRNVLFYGPPGTGKTMFAKRLARHSGLDYAIMTGFIDMLIPQPKMEAGSKGHRGGLALTRIGFVWIRDLLHTYDMPLEVKITIKFV